jgi:hypothetical protein
LLIANIRGWHHCSAHARPNVHILLLFSVTDVFILFFLVERRCYCTNENQDFLGTVVSSSPAEKSHVE